MADEPKRISQLDAAGPLTGAEFIPVVQNSRTKRATLDSINDSGDSSCQCTLASRYTAISTTADQVEIYTQTYTLPANTVSTDGSWLEIFAWGSFAANNNNKTITLYFGAESYTQTYSSSTGNAGRWMISAKIIRSGSATQAGFVEIDSNKDTTPNSSAGNSIIVSGSETWADAITIAVSIQNGTSTADDITSNGLIVRHNKMDANT